MNTLVINYIGREKRFALLKDNKVDKLVIEQPQQQSSVGNIYLGFVTKVLPGMNAAFVQFGEEKEGFLQIGQIPAYLEDKDSASIRGISSYVRQGERILVQIEKDPTGTKGARLTGIIEFSGKSIVYMPQGHYIAVSKKIQNEEKRESWRQFGLRVKREKEGFIFRTEIENHSEEEIMAELEQLRSQADSIVKQASGLKKPALLLKQDTFFEHIKEEIKKLDAGEIIVDDLNIKKQIAQLKPDLNVQFYTNKENIFSAYHLDHDVEKALKKIVWLENGAYLIFDETEALTIIDVNTGKFSGKNEREDTVLKTNEWAAEEIARQIRLRDLAGMILIDFIDMNEEKNRSKVQKKLADELSKDERRTKIIGFTPLGILQLTRKRTKISLSEALQQKCPVCEGKGRILSAESLAFQLERELWELKGTDHDAVLIEATSDVQSVFSGEQNVHKDRLEAALGLQIYFLHNEGIKPVYNIGLLGSVEEIKKKL